MIVFDLRCLDGGEQFEAWFASNDDFERQVAGGLVRCPTCHSASVEKAPMAPLVPRKGDGMPGSRIAALQARLLKDSRWVGDEFADTARAMHLGEIEVATVHGQATSDEVESLLDDGIPVAPLPLPVVSPNQVN